MPPLLTTPCPLTHPCLVLCYAFTSHAALLANSACSPARRGEQTATALEKNLSSLEKKLDELLASFEGMGESAVEEPPAGEEKPPQPETGKSQEPASGGGNDGSR